jgi:tetratricopeptide (TPR) repeat protein
MIRSLLLALLLLAPAPAVAILGDEQAAPEEAAETPPGDAALYAEARALVRAERYDEAIAVIERMANPESDGALTLLAYAHRKAGRTDLGMELYERAIAQNPDNLLARAYKGMAHAEAGETDLARAELAEIEARGGNETSAAEALSATLRGEAGFKY